MWKYINTIQGPSHKGGGIDMILNNLPVEVEGGELLMKHSDGRVGVVPKRHASYVKELHDTNNPLLSEYMDSLQKYGEYAQDGTIVPIHGLKDPLKSDNDIKRQVRELAPGLTSIYGNDLKYLDIYSDESYKAKEYGYGGIEFMKPWQKGVNYDDRYGYPNHSYGTSRDMIVYNPNESNIGDVVLDAVSHGFREDPRYRDVAETIIGDDLSDIDHFYKLSGMKQPYDEFSNNWIDSKIRAYIATNYDIPVSEATKADYGMEVFGDSSRKVLDKYSRDVIMKRRDMSNPFVRGAVKMQDGGIIPPNAHVQSTTKNVSLRLPPKLGAGIIKKESVENIYKSSQDELKQTLLDRKRKGIESYITNLEGRFSKDEIKFLDTHYPHAKSISEKYGYDVASILAHSGTETTFNTSKYVGNNPFGIKARKDKDMNPLEPAVLAKTHEWFDDDMQDDRFIKVYNKEYREDRDRWKYEVDDYFVSNESLEDAYEKYVKFLEGNKRYSNVVLNKSDSNMFLEALGKSGYSTSDKYGETLKSNLNKVNDYIKLRELKDELDIFGIYNINE